MPATRASGRLRPISIARRPLTALLLPVPIVCFIGVLLTDIAYLNSGGNLVWLDFSSWLLLAGLIFGAIAAVLLFVDTVRSSVSWVALIALVTAWLVELLSMFVHERDGWTAVAGLGLILSIIGAILILIAGWLRRPVAEAVR
jgi:uncharacterized membrane protein